MEEADPICTGMDWEGSWWPPEANSQKGVWQPWRSLSTQNYLMALLGDINKEEWSSLLRIRQKGYVNT